MTIFDREPATWQELQNMVGQLFRELGCDVEISKRVPHVRGVKEIDVFVRDIIITPSSIYLCECKHWRSAVPQEIVHSFRTVMMDIGAHRGFIISSRGFQSGAREAAANTNIDLVTFAELQNIFADRWRISMGERLMPYTDPLFPYWDYPGRMPRFQWRPVHVTRQRRLMDAYEPLIHLGPLSRDQQFRRNFPIVLPAVNALGQFDGQIVIASYRQLYDFIEANKDIAMYHFRVLHGEIPPKPIQGEYDPMVQDVPPGC